MRPHKWFLAATLACLAAAGRVDRITFDSNGTQIVGYHWRPTRKGLHGALSQPGSSMPVIVMAHGLAALQTSMLQPYAERFAAEGYNAITFDYRHWGQSDGQPRNIVDLDLQQEDYRAAVKAVKHLKGVDPSRIVIWGSSLSGGTVLKLGASFYNDSCSGVVGVISQVPHVNGLATSLLTPQDTIPNLVRLSLDDVARSKNGSEPIYIPVANYTGQLGLLTQPGAYDGYFYIQPNPPPPQFNNIAARFVIALPLFSPDSTAAQSRLPTYIGIGEVDNVVSPTAAVNLSAKMPNATTYTFAGAGHFDVYPGKPAYEENLDKQVAFLKKFVPLPRLKKGLWWIPV